MITGIQITKANDQALVNSFWLLDDEKRKLAACAPRPTTRKIRLSR